MDEDFQHIFIQFETNKVTIITDEFFRISYNTLTIRELERSANCILDSP